MHTAIRSDSGPALPFVSVFAEENRERAIEEMMNAIHRANDAIRQAVEAGVSVELMRTCRHHDGCGNWGDQIMPALRGAPGMQ